MAPPASPVYDRVQERCRAIALARHFREAEGLTIAQIADRLGRSPVTCVRAVAVRALPNRAPRTRVLGAAAHAGLAIGDREMAGMDEPEDRRRGLDPAR